jgi:hypothetical protein
MKRTLFALAAILAFVATPAIAQVKPNFSGTWQLDVVKSDFGGQPAPESMTLTIVHKDPSIKTTSTQKTAEMGEVKNDRNITTDGKENANKLNMGMMGEQNITSKTTWVGKTLVTTYSLEVQGMSLAVKDTWDLSADGKVLTSTRVITTPDGDLTLKMLFNKQS